LYRCAFFCVGVFFRDRLKNATRVGKIETAEIRRKIAREEKGGSEYGVIRTGRLRKRERESKRDKAR
jgi:hypothetical protein